MQRNQYTTLDDFLADESFRNWVKYGEDTDGWEAWTVDQPERARVVAEARLWVMAMRVPVTGLSTAETLAARTDTWTKIRATEAAQTAKAGVPIPHWRTGRGGPSDRPNMYRIQPVWWRSAAAILVLGVALTWLYRAQEIAKPTFTNRQPVGQTPGGLLAQTNHTDKPQLITLSDGSSVLLQPNSQLSYPKRFANDARRVYLTGEGFFEISKNPQKPFLVFANELVTTVIGTSFRVKAYSDQPHVEVVVSTGRVNVSLSQNPVPGAPKALLLLPKQAVRFTRQTGDFEKFTNLPLADLGKQTPGTIEQVNFDFTDVPVATILKTIEQAYLVEIDFPREKLRECFLTTSLVDQPLPEKLNIICESIGNNTRYEMNGNTITIITNGCN